MNRKILLAILAATMLLSACATRYRTCPTYSKAPANGENTAHPAQTMAAKP